MIPNLETLGALAVAVPGELMGYWEAHKRFGRLSWSDVIAPTIKICKEGYQMTQHQSFSVEQKKQFILKDPYLK
jgi:gamma-glutamyltranspeptidase / glutathione hydrolase / leukotriene-C4 hydrolase